MIAEFSKTRIDEHDKYYGRKNHWCIAFVIKLFTLQTSAIFVFLFSEGRMGRVKIKMADSELDDTEDQILKKGEKRRQEDSEEESDEDLSSEEHSDASDESFDENMVRIFGCRIIPRSGFQTTCEF